MSEPLYRVVINTEDHYLIVEDGKPIPDDWRLEGTTGTQQECFDHIKVVWVDQRPAALKRKMNAVGLDKHPLYQVMDIDSGKMFSIWADGRIEGFGENAHIVVCNLGMYGQALINHHRETMERHGLPHEPKERK